MAAFTHKITRKGSEAPAEKITQATYDLLKEQKRLKLYDVEEIKPVEKPTELTATKEPKAGAGK